MKIGRELTAEPGKRGGVCEKTAANFLSVDILWTFLTKTTGQILAISQTPETTKPRIVGLQDMVRYQESNQTLTDCFV